MNCPVCAGRLIVKLTRGDCERVVRQHKCRECGYVFFTVETEIDEKDVSKELKGIWKRSKD